MNEEFDIKAKRISILDTYGNVTRGKTILDNVKRIL